MTFADLIGMAAGFCTTVSFCPQIVRIQRTKSAEDVSLVMIFILLAGIALWLLYGILPRSCRSSSRTARRLSSS